MTCFDVLQVQTVLGEGVTCCDVLQVQCWRGQVTCCDVLQVHTVLGEEVTCCGVLQVQTVLEGSGDVLWRAAGADSVGGRG